MSDVLPFSAAAGAQTRLQPLLWFHLCDLDAPAVAIVWQMLISRSFGLPVGSYAVAALGVSVWVIYAGDRLLDSKRLPDSQQTTRHRFHARHQHFFSAGIVAGLGLLLLLAFALPFVLVETGGALAAFVGLYFVLIHRSPHSLGPLLPKEVVVGVVFSVGTCLAPWIEASRPTSMLGSALLFAVLCSLNCSAIETWEWRAHSADPTVAPHCATLWLANRLPFCLLFVAVCAALIVLFEPPRLPGAALLISSGAFLWLESGRDLLPADLLRILVDSSLLTPLVFLSPFVWHS